MATPHRDEQCPERGPGLSHTQDITERPDGRCVHCGCALRVMEEAPLPPIALGWGEDRPRAGQCTWFASHLSLCVYRYGPPARPEFICLSHLAVIARNGPPQPPA